MSNLSSYSLIDDDHIDDQETINVGNLIIDLESDLEKEKIVNERANHNVNLGNNAKCSTSNSTNAPSSTSQLATPSSSSNHFTHKTINETSLNNNFDSSRPIGKANQKQHASKKDLASVNIQNSGSVNNNGHTLTARTVFKSSADERGELKMKITRETKPGKNEHRIVTSPNQKSPTSSSGSGGNNTINLNVAEQMTNYEDTSTNEPTFKSKQSSISSTKECGTSTSIGTITEPDCLGPCEPGTSVTLEGIVWQETDGGILVVNVTWRGKTYVGALLDCTRHDWAPPRLCDSPASDIDAKTSKGMRSKRIVTRSNGIGLDEKNLLQTTGKLRNGKGRRIPSTNDPTCSKKQRETTDKASNETSSAQLEANTLQANMSSTNSETACVPMNIDAPSASNDTNTNTNNNNNENNNNDQQESTNESSNISIDKTGPNSPMLIGCSEPNCSKKYRNMNGLLYHQSHAHTAENESPSSQDEPSATKDADQEPRTSPPNNNLSIKSVSDPNSNLNPNPNINPNPNLNPIPIPNPEPRSSSPRNRDDSLTIKHVERERRPSPGYANVPSMPDVGRKSPGMNQKYQEPMNHGSSSSSSRSNQLIPTPKSSPHVSKQQLPNPQPPLPTLAEEGMKPSGTSTGPPPAPHQANCYFNPAFLANTFNPYGMAPFFPRHMYDPLAPPPIATSNAAFMSRFVNSMRVPPPPDSPSRLLSPSMPKNVPFPPFKIDTGVLPPPPPPQHPHQIPTSHPLPNMAGMSNPPMPHIPVPPAPPLASMPGGPPNLRMPSQGDSLLPPTSQPPFLSPAGMNPTLGIPGMGNPLGPLMPNLVEDQMAKQYPRRLN
uniref:Zinc finger protein 608 n=1 Tax=Aceria tosichella TaxID=561515 RepID=A0A6G1S7T8_9ACAR